MRLAGWLVVVPILLTPPRVHAQSSVAFTDLVGTWVGGPTDGTGKATTNDTIVIRPDSTHNWNKGKGGKTFSRLKRMTGDTISFLGGPGFQVTLKDHQLVLKGLGQNKGREYAFKQVDTPKSTP